MSIVEFAAWIIVGEIVGKIITLQRKNRREKLEHLAVLAEHDDDKTSNQRRERLERRYPSYFISAPDRRYLVEASEQLKPVPLSRKERFDHWMRNLGGLTIGLAVAGIFWLVIHLLKSLF